MTPSAPIMSSSSTPFVALDSPLETLQKTVCMRQTAIKVVGCCCGGIPLSIFCCLATCCCRGEYYDPNTKISYSNWTLCSAGSCWQPRLPPNDKCDLYTSVCDPCICCICCTDESPENYLIPSEREELHKARREILSQDIEAGLNHEESEPAWNESSCSTICKIFGDIQEHPLRGPRLFPGLYGRRHQRMFRYLTY